MVSSESPPFKPAAATAAELSIGTECDVWTSPWCSVCVIMMRRLQTFYIHWVESVWQPFKRTTKRIWQKSGSWSCVTKMYFCIIVEWCFLTDYYVRLALEPVHTWLLLSSPSLCFTQCCKLHLAKFSFYLLKPKVWRGNSIPTSLHKVNRYGWPVFSVGDQQLYRIPSLLYKELANSPQVIIHLEFKIKSASIKTKVK